jgi:tetratricopeptide (TPR) repeat protein
MLAQALSDAGNTSEAYAYFTNLWEAQPGSGPLNLQLARLTAKMRKPREAVQYYRAAVYGTWEGDGSVRRREVRLELIRYLMDQKDFATAQTELLIAAGNASDDPGLELELASLMAGSGDYNSALPLYQNVIKASPSNGSAFEGAGVAAFQLARYPDARRYLEVAQRFLSEGDRGGLTTNAASLLQQSQRILELNPSPSLPDRERVKRILAARSLAQQRLNWCHLQLAAAGDSPAELTELDNLWNSPDAKTLPARLRGDSELQQQTMQSVYHTEIVTNNACGAPSGDDALLLLLAKATGNNQ